MADISKHHLLHASSNIRTSAVFLTVWPVQSGHEKCHQHSSKMSSKDVWAAHTRHPPTALACVCASACAFVRVCTKLVSLQQEGSELIWLKVFHGVGFVPVTSKLGTTPQPFIYSFPNCSTGHNIVRTTALDNIAWSALRSLCAKRDLFNKPAPMFA